jgi:ATP-dependent helicase Lhr and Lhr-like helicase
VDASRASGRSALSCFSARTRDWFDDAFGTPTRAQELAWPAIAGGEHVLLSAPTGSGKTLAAFLWAIDRLGGAPPADGGVRVLYVSPLKALSYDIERNLRAPLRGIGAEVRVGVRTGDTPQRERAAMARKPPDILITTPESLYLILGSRAREMLRTVETVIVDEIHAVAATKRGAHLAITLERLDEQARGQREIQRIGLSATQSPLEEIGRFLVGPRREVQILDAGVRKALDLKIHVPVESMTEPDLPGAEGSARDPLQPLVGGEPTAGSIWPAIYPELLALVREHRSTIVFVNDRRSSERVALRLNELAQDVVARAHHGSLSREERAGVEELLKAGELPCIVATSSLELGIDMGAVDLVLQIESPKSVSRGLQRIGRSGHGVGDVSKGRIFPKFRGDLLESAVVCRRMREGLIEPTVVPQNPLDVLAQQIVAIAAAAEEEGAAPIPQNDGDGVAVDRLHALLTRTHSYGELSMGLLENVLDMLDGRYPSSEFGELRPRIVWDRVAGRIRARAGARQLAIANAGTIPDRGLYTVTLPDGRRVGELDEEMVYEARPGQVVLLGASSWRIEEIQRDRVIVTPAPGVPGAVPFWKGDGVGRPKELGRAIGEFARWAVDQDERTLAHEYDLDERAAANLLDYLREQQAATRVLPSDRTIVLERFRDEIGDYRLCLLSPYGGRVHAAWGLAISARIREHFGIDGEAMWSDDGVIVRLPDADLDDAPGEQTLSDAELVCFEPEEVEAAIVGELGGSALFGARFRENAARALLIPRAWPGRRTPLWQQRLKAQSLLEVAQRYPDFPIVLETYRECLRDVLDVPGLVELLAALRRRDLSLVEIETPAASPFAGSLLFDYVAKYMYEGDAPAAERRAAALSLDRELLAELLGSEALRELIDPDALRAVEEDLQRRSPRSRAASSDELCETLRRIGDLRESELAERVHDGVDAAALLERLIDQRRAVRVRVAGQERVIAADDAGLYRDALGVVPPGGLPSAFLAEVPDALRALVARYARTHGPFTADELRERYRVDASSALRELERSGEIVRGELRPGGSGREWCELEVLRRLRRASLAALRKEIEAVDARSLAAFMPSWQGIDRWRAGSAVADGPGRLREALGPLQGLALPASSWERDVLPRRTGSYSPAWLDTLCASGEVVWVGAGALGRGSGRVALYFRDDAPLLGPPPPAGRGGEPPSGSEHVLVRERLERGPCFFSDLLAEIDLDGSTLARALWELVWAGIVTNDAWAPLRAVRAASVQGAGPSGGSPPGVRGARSLRMAPRGARALGRPRRAHSGAADASLSGRWSLVRSIFGEDVDPAARRRAQTEQLLERYGVLTREQALAEGVPGGFASLYSALSELEVLGVCRRGYFVEGLGGAQFALPGAVERLRSARPADRDAADPGVLVIGAVDPAQPYGAVLPWPRIEGQTRRPARVAGAYVVLVGAQPVLYLERGGRGLLTLDGSAAQGVQPGQNASKRIETALRALADAARSGLVGRITLERLDGEPAIGSPLEPLLVELGFRSGPRRLVLGA